MVAEPRMTLQTLRVLGVLLQEKTGEQYGLEISRQAGLPTGSIYPILARLEAAGWVTSAWEEIDPAKAGRRPRRYYRLTASGIERAQQAMRVVRGSLMPRGDPSALGSYLHGESA
jgi:PadR family transcriptional regulator, regulatory protein PadR